MRGASGFTGSATSIDLFIDRSLSGKVATGGRDHRAVGIGQAGLQAFGWGAQVVLWRASGEGSAVLEKIEVGRQARFVSCDLSISAIATSWSPP
jgi:hypothetical protein